MKLSIGAARAVLVIAALCPTGAVAQSTDAFVLPWGMFRLSGGGTHESFDARFDAAGARTPLAAGFSGDLTPERFAALRPLESQLEQFFAATIAGPGDTGSEVDPAVISLGLLDVGASATRTFAPAALSVGLLPRVEIGVSVPITRGERSLQRLGLVGGSLGVNPDPEGNGRILSGLGWGPLGASGLLPVADSPAGLELQSRVTALTGEAMSLPADTAGIEALQALLEGLYGVPPLQGRLDPWRMGDTEIFARVLLISTIGQAPLPVDPAGLDMRIALSGGIRFPTGTEADSLGLLAPQPTVGFSGYHAGAAGDFFLGPRFWMTGSARLTRNSESDFLRRVAPEDSPLSVDSPPQTVTVSPGNILEIAVAPRYRMLESISIGAEYSAVLVGDTEYRGVEGTDASILSLTGGRLHRVGLGIRYSSLPAYWDRRATLPAEVSLTYERTLAGSEGAAAGGSVTITASLLPQLWGR